MLRRTGVDDDRTDGPAPLAGVDPAAAVTGAMSRSASPGPASRLAGRTCEDDPVAAADAAGVLAPAVAVADDAAA